MSYDPTVAFAEMFDKFFDILNVTNFIRSKRPSLPLTIQFPQRYKYMVHVHMHVVLFLSVTEGDISFPSIQLVVKCRHLKRL